MPAPTRNPSAGGPAATAAAPGQWGAWAGDQRAAGADAYGRNEPQYPPVAGPPGAGSPLVGPPMAGPPVDDGRGGPPDRPDRRAWWIAGAIVLVLLIATGVYLIARTGNGQPAAASTTSSPAVAPPVSASSRSSSASSSASTRSSSSARSTPPTTTTPSTTSASTTSSAAVVAPKIIDFGGKTIPDGGTVQCPEENSSVDIPLVWSSTNATKAWTGIDVKGGDASKAPFDGGGVPTSSTTEYLPFSCSAPRHTFTLTVQNATGQSASKTITLVRALPETSSSQTSSASSTPSTSSSETTPTSSSSSSSSSTPATTSSTPTTSSAASTPATS